MPVKKRWHIRFTSTDSAQPFSLSFTRNTGIVLLCLLAVLLSFFAFSVYRTSANQYKIAEANKVIEENEVLKEKITFLSGQMDSVLYKLKLMEAWEDKVRSEENFKSINKDIREMGTGGMPVVDSSFAFLDAEYNLSYNKVLTKLDRVQRKISFDYESHQKVLENVELKDLLYLNTPSIYPTYGRISDKYGYRTHPITKKRSFHYGLDFANKTGTPIYATADGVVSEVGRLKLFGKYIKITHKFGYTTRYAHLNKSNVKKGDVVKRGEIIAEMGNTGRSTGSHLHYEVLRYNKKRNPYKYLNKMEDDIIITQK